MSPAEPDPLPPDQPPSPPLTEDQIAQALQELLARHCNQLAEHFTSVQIIATKLESDGATRRFDEGTGDLYARRGAVRTWSKKQERNSR